MVSDRVGDFIIRLQNAVMIGKHEVRTPYSKHLASIASKLKNLGFLTSVEEKEEFPRELVVSLAYDESGKAKLRGVKRVSKPGRRLYVGHEEAHRVKGGTGARLISSSKGVMTDSEARKERVGGENLFEIW